MSERRLIHTGKDSNGFEVIRVHPDLLYIIKDAFGANYGTQESELTKLRKRVEVLERQIERAKSALTNISQDKWARNEVMKNYDCTVGDVVDEALKYISESAKIAESKD